MRVAVAMSGGVDSSVVAGLMARAGHEVVGITLQLYDHGGAAARKGACCAGQDIYDARRVADRLGIAHYVVDAQARFRDSVIGSFADSYAAGQTPVPCIACNQHLKFGDLLGMARDFGAQALATGHYVRRVEAADGAQMHKAADEARDQSWFLFATTREQLEFCRFPLGDYAAKADVRRLAAEMGLAVAEKPDSQDICFVPTGAYADIIEKIRPEALIPGDIVDAAGVVVGRHEGIARYTIGQAKRLGNAAQIGGQRQAVQQIDAATRRITIGPGAAQRTRIRLRDTNWLTAAPPVAGRVKLRARDELRPAQVGADAQGAFLDLHSAAIAAPGQAAVLYDGTRVLGGGFIA
jgi:tRNA-specific 2-thiouridylase